MIFNQQGAASGGGGIGIVQYVFGTESSPMARVDVKAENLFTAMFFGGASSSETPGPMHYTTASPVQCYAALGTLFSISDYINPWMTGPPQVRAKGFDGDVIASIGYLPSDSIVQIDNGYAFAIPSTYDGYTVGAVEITFI